MTLTEWALKWAVPLAAIRDLEASWGVATDPAPSAATSEAGAMSRIRLEATARGLRLWRNNNGAATMEDGSFIRFGLANDSEKLNKVFKSSDLIGIRPVAIGTQHFGHVLGQFVAREVKEPGWIYSGTEREAAQLAFIKLITKFGGDASFATGEGTL